MKEFSNFGKQISKELTQKFRDQILKLEFEGDSNEKKTVLNSFKSKLLKSKSRSQAQQLADIVVNHVTFFFFERDIHWDDSLEDLKYTIISSLVRKEVKSENVLSKIKSNVIKNLNLSKLTTNRDGEKWNLVELFWRCGLKTVDEKFFEGSDTDSVLYGYRYGTEEEASSLNMKRVSANGSATSSPEPAASRREVSSNDPSYGNAAQHDLVKELDIDWKEEFLKMRQEMQDQRQEILQLKKKSKDKSESTNEVEDGNQALMTANAFGESSDAPLALKALIIQTNLMQVQLDTLQVHVVKNMTDQEEKVAAVNEEERAKLFKNH